MWDPYNLILLGFGVKKFGSRKSGKNPIFEFPALTVPPWLHPTTRNYRHAILSSWAIIWTYYHIILRFVTVKIFWPYPRITLKSLTFRRISGSQWLLQRRRAAGRAGSTTASSAARNEWAGQRRRLGAADRIEEGHDAPIADGFHQNGRTKRGILGRERRTATFVRRLCC